MYCQSCGSELIEGIRYCKRCGVSLTPAGDRLEESAGSAVARPPKLLGIVMMLSVLTFSCLGALLLFAGTEAHELTGRSLTLIVALGLGMTFLVVRTIIDFVSRMFGLPVGKQVAAQSAKQHPAIGRPAPQIEAPRASVASITENTTRSFHPPDTEGGRIF
jgi:hypothetical protein